MLVVGASSSGTQIADEIQRVGPAGHARGRRAHPRAAHLSRQGYRMVDGRGRRARRALRPGRRHHAGAARALAAACRHARPLDARPQRAVRHRREARRPSRRHHADGKAQFSGSLRNMCALSDLKMRRLLELLDEWARANGLDGTVAPPQRPPPTRVEDVAAARHGSRQERDQDDHLGLRLPAGLLLAGAAGARPQGL